MADEYNKDLCDEKHRVISDTIKDMRDAMDKHCGHIDITFGEIFKMLKERNNKDAYNEGYKDGGKNKQTISTKALLAIIGLISAIVTGIVQVVIAIIN